MPTNTWDRLPKESEEAYAGFLTYRDLGQGRSIRSVSRALHKSCTILGRWSKRHSWVDRSRSWDDHLAAKRQKGIEKAAVDEAEQWERRRLRQAKDDFALARRFLRRARQLAAFPVVQVEKSKDGSSRTYLPISPKDLKDAASIAKDAQAMAWAAIHQALPPDDDDFDPETATIEENRAYLARKGRRRKAQD